MPTEAFFKKHNYFGINPANIKFFNQGVLPAFTPKGKIMMESKTNCVFSPDGNGGIYAALKNEGIIADLEQRNIPYVHAYCVDNCLVKVADPVFIGYCIEKGADVGAKSIPKRNPEEQVGVICLLNGKPSVVEYSEIDQDISRKTDSSGKLLFNAANIANHFYTTKFLKRVDDFADQLEYHVAHKKIAHLNEQGEFIKPEKPNGIKLELFIFDVFPFTENFHCLEGARENEFSPLKNATGSDSPETSRNDIMKQHVRFAENAGAIVQGGLLEISPLVTYGGEGLERLKGVVIKTPKHYSCQSELLG
jgi:UDP-N-acetylglucosamine/UDP-N-acetylgalactosamine diphosphorylase